jgi:ABC-type tungstate transport system substrate-binding protein/ABC-type polar amino acid transport system ATPase subunit
MNTFFDSVVTALNLIASFDPALWTVVVRSLAVSATACLMAYGLGVVLGAWLGVSRFTGRGWVLVGLNTLLALPSVVVGLVVYLLLSRTGPLGFLGWLFSFKAMVLAQFILVVPVVTALTRQVVEDVERQHGEQWASLGARPFLRGILLAWDERLALLTIGVAAFGRAISEVGAVMIVGGNIDGFTRVMTTAIALETSKGDLPLALGLGLVLLSVVLLLNAAVAGLRRWGEKRQGSSVASSKGWGCMTAQSVVQLHEVSVRLGPVWALKGLDLCVQPGERVALVGSNGSGKSSLLRTVHGLLPPDQGRIEWHTGLRQAMLFQRPHLLRMSALNNVTLGLWLDRGQGLNWAQAMVRAGEALQRVGLSAVASQDGRQLSGGQQQRLAMARAWGRQPDVLLLDEPTASLDPHAKREVEALMAAFAAEQGRPLTLIWASHNLGQVKRLASRVIYLEGGRLLADLPVADFFNPAELALHSPAAHAFVQGELS